MEGRTYRYFKGEPLYPFGFGLSFTKFKYSNLKLSANTIKAGENARIAAEVQNVGDVAGDEVVQLYVTDVAASAPVPIRSLAGVKRLFLRPGEKQSVSFTLTPREMSLINDQGRRVIEPGEFLLSVGGKEPGSRGRSDVQSTDVLSSRLMVKDKITEIAER